MKNPYWINCSTALIILFISTKCIAISWQDKLTNLSETAETHQDSVAGTQSGGLSLSSLSTLLEGGNTALRANTLANATGVIEYCIKNKLSSQTNAERIQSKLVKKLGLTHPRSHETKKDYAQGKSGLLNTHNGQQLDMKELGYSELAAEVKMKACNLVFKQGTDYLSR